MNKKITLLFSLLLLFLSVKTARAVDCSFPFSGNTTISSSCTLTADSVAGVDEAGGSEVSTANTAVLTLTSGTVTIPSGVLGTTKLAVGSIILNGGTLAIGSSNAQAKPGTPIYVTDADADGWANSTTFYTATASGRRRRSLMQSISTVDCNDSANSGANSCGHRRAITLTYSGSTLTNHDVVFGVDTATSIASGYMTADCGDILMKDSDLTTQLTYWIESGCNTTNTQIWVRVPEIADGGKTIYMDYDGTTTADGFSSWAGTFTLMYNASCPAGWTQNSTFDNAFPYGSATYGTTGGASSHSHAQVSCTTNSSSLGGARTGGGKPASPTHSHTGAKRDIAAASNVLPPYLDVVMCKKADFVIPASFIAMFDTTVPSGWTRFSTLDNTFPRGATTYGGTGGASTHSHSATGGYATGTSGSQNVAQTSLLEADFSVNHTHTSTSGTTATADNTPPYLDMVFGQANAQTAASAGLIAMTDVIPPLGWTQFSALDSKFPRGAATYGGTGGASTHTHSVSITTGTPSATNTGNGSGSSAGSRYNHTHSCTATSDSQSNLPPYASAIFIKRNTPSPTVSVGNEGNQ